MDLTARIRARKQADEQHVVQAARGNPLMGTVPGTPEHERAKAMATNEQLLEWIRSRRTVKHVVKPDGDPDKFEVIDTQGLLGKKS